MKLKSVSWRIILTRVIVVTIILSLIIPPGTAQAWKSNAHVYLAEIARLDALDGYITLPEYDPDTGLSTGYDLGPYPVDSKIRLALQLCAAQYRAGALGPDAYPDVMTGQLLTHPDNQPNGNPAFSMATNTSQWINALWKAVPYDSINLSSTTCTPALAQLAFATGYLTHTAGDMYGHTFINEFAGGPFKLTKTALQHIIIEGYVDKLIPDDETPNYYNISIDDVTPLINKVLVGQMPGYYDAFNILGDKANFLSLPRFFSSVRRFPERIVASFDDAVAYFDRQIASYNQAASDCAVTDLSCSATWLRAQAASYAAAKLTFQTSTAPARAYMNAWIEDIDNGLQDWITFNHEVALAKLFKPDEGRPQDLLFPEKIADFMTLSLEPMSPLPDGLGVFMRLLIPLGYPEFVDKIMMWGDSVYDYLLDYELYGGITLRKIQEFANNPASLFDIVVLLGDGPQIFRQQFRREHLHLGEQSGVDAVDAIRSDASVRSLIQQARNATGEARVRYLVTALDRAAALEKTLTPEVLDRLFLETLDYTLIPSMRNTVAMDKLIMLSRVGMDQLLNDISYRCEKNLVPTPIMLGTFMRSLDESDQGLNPWAPLDKPSMNLGPLAADKRPLMGIARDPVAYRTVFQLQEGHDDQVLAYLNQNSTQCPSDPQLARCTKSPQSLLAEFRLPAEAAVTDMAFSGDLLYLTAGTGGFYILNIPSLLAGQDPVVSHLPLQSDFYSANILVVNNIPYYAYGQVDAVLEDVTDVAYISDGQTRLVAINVSDPQQPALLSDFTRMEPGFFSSVATDTYGMVKRNFTLESRTITRLLVSAGYNGVLDLEVSTPEIQEMDNLLPSTRLIRNAVERDFNVLDVDLIDDNTLLLTTLRHLLVFDVNPAAVSPILLAYATLPENAYSTELGSGMMAGRAYVADGEGGLRLFDLSGVRANAGIRELGEIDLMGVSVDVAVQNSNTAYVAATNMLYSVNSSSSNLSLRYCPLFEPATRVEISANRLFVGETGLLKVFVLP